MTLLSRNFRLLSFTGLWKPAEWKSWKAQLYNLYTFIVAFANFSFVVSGIMAIDIKNSTLAVIVDNVSLTLAAVNACGKLFCAVFSRKYILKVIDCLQNNPFTPQDPEEVMIFNKFDRYAKYIISYYPLTFVISTAWYSTGHIFMMSPPDVLLYQGWFPYNYSLPAVYWTTAFYQFYTIGSAACVYLAFDPLLPCLICHIYSQIYILKYRFKLLVLSLEKLNCKEYTELQRKIIERNLICNWVEHHIKLLGLVQSINAIFSHVIFLQYAISSLILCTIAKVLTSTPLFSMDFVGNLLFFLAMAKQIFFQCFTVNQMILEFSDITTTLYNTNWFQLSKNIQKSIIVILAKSAKPVIFRSGYFITLSLESFTRIIKFSYTIYNVLE